MDYNLNKNKKIKVEIYDLSSQLIRDRINLLLKNGFRWFNISSNYFIFIFKI